MTEIYKAINAHERGDYTEARKLYGEAGRAGDPRGWYSLGLMHSQGIGGPENPSEAAIYYQLAASQWHPDAAYNLGALYALGRGVKLDYKQALHWYGQAAAGGDADAEFKIGCMFARGEGVVQDMEKAASRWLRAAGQDHAQAMGFLGNYYLYEKADGSCIDRTCMAAGVDWYYRAAAFPEVRKEVQTLLRGLEADLRLHAGAGCVEAQFQLGRLCEVGAFRQGGMQVAARWYQRASEQQHPAALGRLADFHRWGHLGPQSDENKFLPLLTRAAELGDCDSQHNLAFAYFEGEFVSYNLDEAIKWYRKAAEQGALNSQLDLAKVLISYCHSDEEMKEAVRWLRRIVETKKVWESEEDRSSRARAMVMLGEAYMDGRGVERDLVQAARWFYAAQTRGCGDGIHPLHEICTELHPDEIKEADYLSGGTGLFAAATLSMRDELNQRSQSFE